MATFTNKFASIKQDWTTPKSLFNKLNEEFKFEWDLAADAQNALCEKFYSKENNGLNQKWDGVCWLNPPYGDKTSKMVNWIKKAYESTVDNPNLTVVMLIPARSNTRWFANYVAKSYECRFIIGRPKFGDSTHGLPQPLLLVIFKKSKLPTKFSCYYL